MNKLSYFAAIVLVLFSCNKADVAGNENNGQDSPFDIEHDVSITAKDAIAITTYSASLLGNVKLESLPYGSEIGFIVSTSSSFSFDNGQKMQATEIEANGDFSIDITGLSHSTTYYYKAYLRIENFKYLSEVKTFTTAVLSSGAIDMGLSVIWSGTNLGAASPENSGDYFAWGETEIKNDYSIESYKWWQTSAEGPVTIKKYNTNTVCGPVDNITTLLADDDVAHIKLGGKWRMPTETEWDELLTDCNWTWVNQNGVEGYLVTSKHNNASIFLPAAGVSVGSDEPLAGIGCYWSSSLSTKYPINAVCMTFWDDNVEIMYDYRCYGFSIRPVLE